MPVDYASDDIEETSTVNHSDPTSRREFLSRSGRIAAAAATTAAVLPAGRAAASANEKIALGIIGCGGIMNHHVSSLVKRQSAVVFQTLCDVDPAQRTRIKKHLPGFQSFAPQETFDYHKVLDDQDIDAVIIATPHHWHMPIALGALAAGKDVYLEKPASHVFREGRLLIEAAKKYDRVVQHGTQMRSSKVTAAAGKILDSGILGEVKIAKAWNVQDRGTRTVVADSNPPAGVDYDRWLGPAPKRAFNVNRFHVNWRVYRDYGNGDIGDDGAHDLDMARWALGVETLPIRVTAHGSTVQLRGDREYPDNMMVAYQYADDKVLLYEDRLFTPYGLHGFDSGNAFYGTEGYMIFSRRGYFQVYLGPKEEKGPGVPAAIRGNAGRGYVEHMDNFLACVRSREKTAAPPETAHLSCGVIHLGEIAYRTVGRLEIDPETESVRDNPQATAMLTKSYRSPYTLPAVV